MLLQARMNAVGEAFIFVGWGTACRSILFQGGVFVFGKIWSFVHLFCPF